MQETSFRNGEIAIAAQLHLPPDFDGDRTWPARVLSTPGSSVQEQVGASPLRAFRKENMH